MAKEINRLQEAFRQTKRQVGGHGPRNIQVLKDAFRELDGRQESDMYGKRDLIEAFQSKIAAYLGKEAAVFFPSGTMAQQIALRIWCDRKGLRKVAYHPLCHLEIHEEHGLSELHRIEPVLLGEPGRLIGLEDAAGLEEGVACLLLELPQREIGGQLPEYPELEAITAWCRERGVLLHLDGARLFEILPYYGKTASEVSRLFDSVYVSFYKGLGGIAGAVLAGDEDFIREAVVWKRRYGGDLISLYPYIVSADYSFMKRVERMGGYHEAAKELAGRFQSCHPALSTVPRIPVSNMFHVHCDVSQEQMEPLLADLYQETGLGLTGRLRALPGGSCSFEISIGDQYGDIPKEMLDHTFRLLAERLASLFY